MRTVMIYGGRSPGGWETVTGGRQTDTQRELGYIVYLVVLGMI